MSRYIPDSLRRMVAKRANYCCEYCQMKELDAFFTFPVDHIISVKHNGDTTADNLAHCCTLCNTYKGSDIGTMLLPNRVFIRLFNPRIDSWKDHFDMENYVIYAKTSVGEATIKVLKLNDVDRIIERQIIEENS
jgi:5-methylcytosine-specific restriction endonuclease McrA